MTTRTNKTFDCEQERSDRPNEAIASGFSRRDFLKGTGAFIVSCSMAGVTMMVDPATASENLSTLVDPNKLGSWLAIAQDGSVTLFFGKVDNGQGVSTAFRQVVADDLDVPIDRIKVVVGDTALTVDQGGASGSSGLEDGSLPVRSACAEARLVFLEMAAKRFGVPVDKLTVRDGVITVRGDGAKSVSYGELIGGQRLSAALQWNKKLGNELNVTGRAKQKSQDQFRMIGQSIPRWDIPPIVFGKEHYVADLRLPGMAHARSIKPPVAAARLVKVDESSISKVPGVLKVVTKGNYVGVVCEREEHAIRASEQLKVTWSEPSEASFPTDSVGVHDYLRRAKSRFDQVAQNVGNIDEALGRATRVVEATFETPMQSHASFGPGCAVAHCSETNRSPQGGG